MAQYTNSGNGVYAYPINDTSVIASKRCVNCNLYAVYTYNGNSLCQECFKKEKETKQFVMLKGGEK